MKLKLIKLCFSSRSEKKIVLSKQKIVIILQGLWTLVCKQKGFKNFVIDIALEKEKRGKQSGFVIFLINREKERGGKRIATQNTRLLPYAHKTPITYQTATRSIFQRPQTLLHGCRVRNRFPNKNNWKPNKSVNTLLRNGITNWNFNLGMYQQTEYAHAFLLLIMWLREITKYT